MMRDIYEEVGEPAALELVAEEAAELAQACLKLSRILRGENPTPVPEVLAAEKVMEEAADVQTALSVLSSAQWYDEDKVMHIQWKNQSAGKSGSGNGRRGTMQKGLFKKSGLEGLFTDFKHHARSWRNSKHMRAKRERQWLKKLRKNGDDK